ncbi:hypothetical protein SSBR45G_12020 [Bradyrhizobium sp. SSBR45G]|uniref:hypothetical protein n=1 Tax=unclassified Bradyrhizobium TaxID=2631580 RepID=UPI002342A4C9|nr:MULTISPECIES: hypothetical protein [unclassified Bradyrhizobium]GLH76294.1 hypothetical protein SSBR45G_12020 [Bradyrhizobium sp. SSBR45G]GLH83223.1 hypothetical protein SSBR45R_06830 [Bradyrhizobium sp. SSBR45R]
MNIDDNKKSRAALKSYFVKNAIPTEQQFSQLIDSVLNQRDDGVIKPGSGEPLSIEAVGDFEKALNFYMQITDASPAWTLSLRPRSNPADPQTGKPGLSFNDPNGVSRLAINAATGSVGIGVVTPTEALEVNGRIKATQLVIGPWPANPSQYGFVGVTSLDQTQGQNYALLQSSSGADLGTTYLNSPVAVRLRIKNADRMVVTTNGNVGIGTATPANLLEVAGVAKFGSLGIGPWPTGGNYMHFGVTTLNQAAAGNYALLQSAAGGDLGMTFLNSPTSVRLRIGNDDRLVIDPGETTSLRPFKTQGAHIIKIGHPSPNGRYGNDGIRGEPNLWLDSSGTVFIKQGFQATGLDVAERFPAGEPLVPGDVAVFDEHDRKIRRCDRAVDRRAVGIVSGDAAFILGIEAEEVPIALCGRVACKVDADIAPIVAGDLLTTSATRGYAQKVDDPATCAGAIIGKALTSLASGQGEILVMVHGR